MPGEHLRFHFRVATPAGELFAGQLQAASIDEAITILRSRGFQPLQVDSRPIRSSWLNREIELGTRHLTTLEAVGFCRELSLLLGSGMPLVQALGMMVALLPQRSRLGPFTTSVRHGLQLGRPLSEALGGAGYRLPTDLVPVVRAGESSGTLVAVLDMLAASYTEADRFRRALAAASAYPALLLVVALGVFGLLGLFVAPSLSTLFTSLDRPVPAALAALDAAGTFIRAHGLAAGAGVVGLSVLGGTLWRPVLMRLAAALPLLGPALRWAAVRRFVGTLRLQLGSRIPIATALEAAFAAADFAGMASRVAAAVAHVRAGATLGQELGDIRLFPRKVVHLIKIGEDSARLPELLGLLEQEARAEFERRMSALTSVLAPVLILVVGGLIAAVIVSVFSALLEINEVGF